MQCTAQKLVLNSETWRVFPARGQAVVYHHGFVFVVGGKRSASPFSSFTALLFAFIH